MLQRSAAARGIDRLCGHVLRNNVRMSGWLEARGWRMAPDPDDPGVVCAELPLATSAAPAWRERLSGTKSGSDPDFGLTLSGCAENRGLTPIYFSGAAQWPAPSTFSWPSCHGGGSSKRLCGAERATSRWR